MERKIDRGIIGSKAVVKKLMEDVTADPNLATAAFVKKINNRLLEKKIRFPLLEYAAETLYDFIPVARQLEVTDRIMALHTIGGNVLVAIILQSRLGSRFKESHQKAIEYIVKEDLWYVCDIIGERVTGYSLLHYPEKTLSLLKTYTRHMDKWVVRSIGVATHYAVKNGLKKKHVEEVFCILLSCAKTTDFHTKKGIGWGAKTISKFHPEIVKKYGQQIKKDPEIKQWFKTKIKLGLSRSFKYASRNTG